MKWRLDRLYRLFHLALLGSALAALILIAAAPDWRWHIAFASLFLTCLLVALFTALTFRRDQ